MIGYASLSPYRFKGCFSKSTVELSIYIHQDYRGQGVATQLMERIIAMAKSDDTLHNVVSVITAGNEGSTKLHNSIRFYLLWTYPEVGFNMEISGYRNLRIIGIIIDIKSFIYSWGCGCMLYIDRGKL